MGTDQQGTPLSAEERLDALMERCIGAGLHGLIPDILGIKATLDAARERPSALDVERLVDAIEPVLAEKLGDLEGVGPFTRDSVAEAIAIRILARLTEPDAGEGTHEYERGEGIYCVVCGETRDNRRHAPTPDTTEATTEQPAVQPEPCDCDCHADPELDPSYCDRCSGMSESERCVNQRLGLQVAAPTPDTTEATLRAAGEGYEVRVWQRHEPSGVVVLPGHPQLGGRYCQTDGGDWPCATVRAALQQPAARPEHEHYWTDAPDDEEAWHCSICGLTTWATNPPYGSDSAAVQPERGPE